MKGLIEKEVYKDGKEFVLRVERNDDDTISFKVTAVLVEVNDYTGVDEELMDVMNRLEKDLSKFTGIYI